MPCKGSVALGLVSLTALVCSLLYIAPEFLSGESGDTVELGSRELVSTDEEAFEMIRSSVAFLERHPRHDPTSSTSHDSETQLAYSTTPAPTPTSGTDLAFVAGNDKGSTKAINHDVLALRSVVLIIRNWREERKEFLLKLYRPFFLDVIFFEKVVYQGEHLSLVIGDLKKKYPTCQGLLSIHMDMWIQPSRLAAKVNTGALWFAGPGLMYEGLRKDRCFNRDELAREASTPHWNWWDNARNRSEVVIEKLHRALDLPLDEVSICVGWQDLFYLPKAAWDGYQKILALLVEIKNDEVIVPTAMHALAKLDRHSSLFLNNCWGGCCQQPTEDAAIIHEHICGHRMHLSSAVARKAIWEANHPTLPFEEV